MPYLVVDLEMSGPEPGYHEIIQIGAVLLNDNWVELGTYLSNVYPENEEALTGKIPGARLFPKCLGQGGERPAPKRKRRAFGKKTNVRPM